MDIKDVKVGDRCWVPYFNLKGDAFGQNATVTDIWEKTISVLVDEMTTSSFVTPGDNAFWRKPEAPPKPKRIVPMKHSGVVDGASVCYTERWSKVEILLPAAIRFRLGMGVTLSWEEEQ